MKDKAWSTSTVEQCYSILLEDLPLSATAPGGMIEYRKTLAQSFLFKFYLQVNDRLSRFTKGFDVDSKHVSALSEIHRGVSCGKQVYQESKDAGVVGKSVVHAASKQQVSGGAVYVDDIPKFHNELYAVIVPSTVAHGIIE